jgi:EAL domain-containing protein (putative c-di-GMP-specific phosphodiesterase class I)
MDSQSSHPSVQLAHLRSLNLCGSATRLLDKVILPELREVVIDTKRDTWRYTSQFISLLSRCSLEVLSFSAAIYQPSHNDMIKILETCTSLVQLELLDRISRCMTETFISRLTYYRGQENSNMPQLLPRLDTIMVDYAPSYFDMLAFADAIESRMSDNTLVAGFKRVEIRIPERAVESLDPTILSRLRRLRDNGLKITVLQGCKDLL